MLTLLDLAKRKVADAEVGLIDETVRFIPEVSGRTIQGTAIPGLGAAKPIRSTNYITRTRIALPSVSFRDIGVGTPSREAQTQNTLVSCFIMNPRWDIDKAANGIDMNVMEALAEEADAALTAVWQQLGRQHYYGRRTAQGGQASGFPGLLDSVQSSMVVDATGTTNNVASSVWGVKYGVQGLRWVLGNDGQFEITDPKEIEKLDASNNPYTAIMQQLYAHVGLQVGHSFSCGRIQNLTTDSGKGLTTGLLRQLHQRFLDRGIMPDAYLMSPRSYMQYRNHLESLGYALNSATFNDFEGVPIAVTNSILDTEPLNLT